MPLEVRRTGCRAAALAVTALAASCAPSEPAVMPPTRPLRSELAVPFGDAPVIDGKVGDAEWGQATEIAIEPDVRLRVMHDGARIYLGVSRARPTTEFGFTCVLIAEPTQVRVLHASAKLGSAIYTQGARGRFQPRSKTYTWRAGDELMAEEGWTATPVSDSNRDQQELAIAYSALGLPDQPRPIAIGYFSIMPGSTQPAALVWPAGLDDAVANTQLLGGHNPDDLLFDPARWVVLRPQPR